MFDIPEDSWDTHCHVFDPNLHPYIENTPYAPPKRVLADLLQAIPVSNFVIVMSVPEGVNYDHTLDTIDQIQSKQRTGRGVIVVDVENLSDLQLDELHRRGVRSLRLHAIRIRAQYGDQVGALENAIEQTCRRLSRLHWLIEAQLDLETWASIGDLLLKLHAELGIIFVADHLFSACGKDHDSIAWLKVLRLMDAGAVIVKVSGLGRASESATLEDMRSLVVDVMKVNDGNQVVFGSDWPHVVMKPGGLLNEVDILHHLSFLSSCCDSDESKWKKLMRDNARKFFA